MHPGFAEIIEEIDLAFAELMSSRPVMLASARFERPVPGVYLLSEANRHLYVGRSHNLGRRLQFHLRGRAHQAPVARLLAVESLRQAGIESPQPYRNGNRSFYLTDSGFLTAFAQAKKALAPCLVRWIEERDPVRRCFLEVYAATALCTPFNTFTQTSRQTAAILR